MSVGSALRSVPSPPPCPRLFQCALALCLALFFILGPVRFFAPAAHAQDTFERWVSIQIGDDSNNCIRTVDPGEEEEDEDEYDTQACATIERALEVANPGDRIYVANGTYGEPLTLLHDITIIGSFPLFSYDGDLDFERVPSPQPNPALSTTTLSANGNPGSSSVTIQNISGPGEGPMQVHLESLTIQGTNPGNNAALRISDLLGFGEITLENVRIQGNVPNVFTGRGLLLEGSVNPLFGRTTVKMEGGAIVNSTGSNGGGAHVIGDATLELLDVLVQGNQATSNGGGIYVTNGGQVIYNGGVVHANTATGRGGGLYATGTTNMITASLGGLTLTGNIAGQGGALAFENTTPTVGDLYFHDNTAHNEGGAVYATGSTFTLSGSTLLTNTASSGNGGGIFLDVRSLNAVTVTSTALQGNQANSGDGGGIYVMRSGLTQGTAVIGGGVDLAGNSAQRGGGAFVATARVTVTGSDFNSNQAGDTGGGLFVDSVASGSVVQGANFSGNHANSGGGLYATGNFALNSPNFTGNRAATGGGFYLTGNTVTAGGNIFLQQNEATGNGGGGYLADGAVLNTASLDAIENTATNGGGLAVTGHARLSVSGAALLQENTAANGGGLHFTASSATQTFNGDLTALANTATQQGGGLYADNAPVQLAGGTFQGNEAENGAGGGLYLTHTTLTAQGQIAFSDNETGHQGGALATQQATVNFQATPSFADNRALNGRGGALALIAPAATPGTATFDNAPQFNNNLAGYGGAIYAEHVTLNFGPGAHFAENGAQDIAQGHGGALYVVGAPLNLDTITFEGNNAAQNGGAIYQQDGDFTAGAGAYFESNFTLGGDGGALYYTRAGGQVTLNGASFAQNRAATHGGALAIPAGHLTINPNPGNDNGSHLTANRAENGNGGALYMADPSATATLDQAVIEGNQASGSNDAGNGAGNGGGLYAQIATLNLAAVNFTGNSSETAGGGLYAQIAGGNIQASEFRENWAQVGGGIYLRGPDGQPGHAHGLDNIVRDNHAGQHGGGLYALGMTLGLERMELLGNAAQNDGGGLYALYSRAGFTNTVVAQNRITETTGTGSGVWARNSTLTLVHSTLAGHTHTAELGSAAAIYLDSPHQGAGPGGFITPAAGSVNIQNSILATNQIGLFLLPGNSATLAHSLWQNSRFDWTGDGDFPSVTANRRGDPRFFNPAQGNYRIRRDSAAFDLGNSNFIDLVTIDKIGISRTQGFAPDAGAFEHRYTRGLYLAAQVTPFARSGDTVEYTIRLRNTSQQTVDEVRFEATLPNSQPTASINGQGCNIFCAVEFDSIGPGQEEIVTITAQVQADPPTAGLANMNANLTVQGNFAQPDAYGDSDKTLTVRSQRFACRVMANGTEYSTVQAAVDAVPGDGSAVIQVHGHCGDVHTNGGPGQAVALNKNVTIQGGWNNDFSVRDPATYPSGIDAGGLGRTVYITGGATPTLEDINLRGGATRGLGGGLWGKDAGGGLYIVDAGATLRSVDIANSRSDDLGGGVYIHSDHSIHIENSAVRQNEAIERGGGLYIAHSDPELVNIAVSGNRARAGGGIYLRQSAATLDAPHAGMPNNPACRIDANQATGSPLWRTPLTTPTLWLAPGGGGGLFAEDSPARVVRCSMRNNQARSGAGVYLHRVPMTLQQSILTGNTTTAPAISSDGAGGGLYVMVNNPGDLAWDSNFFGFNNALRGSAIYAHLLDAAPATLRHTTLAHNLGPSTLYATGPTTLHLSDSIVAFNQQGTSILAGQTGGNSASISLDRTLWHENGTNTGQDGGTVSTQNDFSGDPAFFDDGFRIKRISAAYGRGGSGAALADRDGDARPQGAQRDLGADEYVPAQPVRYVALNGSNSDNTCLDYRNPCRTLQRAVDQADPGDLIKMAGGEYTGVHTRNGHTQVAYINKEVTIQGGYYARTDNNDVTDGVHTLHDWELPHPGENPTIINAASQGRVLTIASPSGQTLAPRLAYLTLERGLTNDVGGGVLVDNANPVFEQVTVRENQATHGGGIYLRNSSGELAQLTLTENRAASENGNNHNQGGGLYIEGGSPILRGLTIEANRAITGAGIYAGDADARLIQNTVRDNGNTATQAGGGIYLHAGTSQVLTNTITGNRAVHGGGLYLDTSAAQVQGNNLADNRAMGNAATGGGVYIVDGAPQFRHNSVTSNRAAHEEAGRGGGLFLGESQAVLEQNEFRDNWATAGGGLYLEDVHRATITQNVVHENRTDQGGTGWGGGLYLNGGTLTLDQNTVHNNRAKRGGGFALVCDAPICSAGVEARATLTANHIHNNRATDHGGGLYIVHSAPVIAENTLARNTTDQGSGAGVYLSQSDTTLTANTIEENQAGLNGGGLYLDRDRSTVRGGEIRANRANSGGGIYFQNQPGAQNSAAAPPHVENLSITNNRATANGGGIYARQSVARLYGLTLRANRATNDGGGVYLEESLLGRFEANVITENEAGGRGGGLALTRRSNTFAASNAITDNTADSDGGGLAILGSSPVWAHTTVARNVPNGIMANTANNEGSQARFYNSIIVEHDQGVRTFAGVQIHLTSTLFHNNQADTSGPSDTVISSNAIEGNPAFGQDGYRLTGGSAAVDAGVYLDDALAGRINGDIDGAARVQGGGPDLGADELAAPCAAVRASDLSTVYNNVQAAIDAARPGGEVRVAGTCTGLFTRNGLRQLAYIDKNLTVRGGYAPNAWNQPPDPRQYPTVLDARDNSDPQSTGRAVYIAPNVLVVLENLTLINGDATGLGGGPDTGNGPGDAGGNLLVDGVSSITLRQVGFRRGRADYGGGLYVRSITGALSDGEFVANTAHTLGGGFYLEGGSSDLAVRHNLVQSNDARTGGGGAVVGGQATVANNRIVDNRTTGQGETGQGGGLYAQNTQGALINNQYTGNRAEAGGALYVAQGAPTVYNNMAGRNIAQQGTAFYFQGAPVNLRHNTLVDNQSPASESDEDENGDAPAAVYFGTDSPLLEFEFANNIVAGHAVGLAAEQGTTGLARANLWYENQTRWTGEITEGQGNRIEPPGLRDRAGGDYFLAPDSPAIDQGVNAGVSIDIQNRPRPARLGYDIGADEFLVPSVSASLSAVPNPVGAGENVGFVAQVNNNGDLDLTAEIVLNLPAGIVTDDAVTFSDVQLGRGANWSRNITARVDEETIGTLDATLVVTTNEGVTATASTELVAADISSDILDILLEAEPSPVSAGSDIQYRLRIANTGGVALDTTVQVTLPPAIVPQSAIGWNPTIAGSGGTWTTTFTGTVTDDAPDTLPVTVQVTSQQGPNGQHTLSTELARPNVNASITAQPDPAESGARLVYRLTLDNTGNVPLNLQVTPTFAPQVVPVDLQQDETYALNLAPNSRDIRTITTTVETGYAGPLESSLDVAATQDISVQAQSTVQARRPVFEPSKVARGGNWHDPATWDPPGVPTREDVVHIPEGVTVLADRSIDIHALRNDGALILRGASDAGAQTQQLRVAHLLENFGLIRGEDGRTAGAPGASISIEMDIQAGSIYNEGTIRAGNGGSDGGNGGTLQLTAGSLTNNGSLLGGQGADITNPNTNAGGGRGGGIFITLEPGQLVNRGLMAAGNGGAAHPNADPTQPGGRGGDITLLGTSLIRVDDSELRAGNGGAGSQSSLDGRRGQIGIAAARVSTVNTLFTPDTPEIVQSGDTDFGFSVLGPSLIVGRVGGNDTVATLRIFNRSARQETYVITPLSAPPGWQPLGLPTSLTVPPFKSQAIGIQIRPPAGVESENAPASASNGDEDSVETARMLGLPLELRVTAQRNSARRVDVPIGIVDGFTLGATTLHLPQIKMGAQEQETGANSDLNIEADTADANRLYVPILAD